MAHLFIKSQILHLTKRNVILQNFRGHMIIFFNFKFQNYHYSFPLFQRYYHQPIYCPPFHHLLRLIILIFPRRFLGTSFQRFKLKIMFKEINKWSKFKHLIFFFFKKVRKNPNLMANGGFQAWLLMGKNLAWWLMEGSKFDDQWGSILFYDQCKVLSFMPNEETSFSCK